MRASEPVLKCVTTNWADETLSSTRTRTTYVEARTLERFGYPRGDQEAVGAVISV